jgi:uncharacterized membrane protein
MGVGDFKIKDQESLEQAQRRKSELVTKKSKVGSKNILISIIRWIGWIIFIIGIYFGVTANFIGDFYFFAGVIGGIIIVGFAEGLDLLQKIYLKLNENP